jgi:hypothetical protein
MRNIISRAWSWANHPSSRKSASHAEQNGVSL